MLATCDWCQQRPSVRLDGKTALCGECDQAIAEAEEIARAIPAGWAGRAAEHGDVRPDPQVPASACAWGQGCHLVATCQRFDALGRGQWVPCCAACQIQPAWPAGGLSDDHLARAADLLLAACALEAPARVAGHTIGLLDAAHLYEAAAVEMALYLQRDSEHAGDVEEARARVVQRAGEACDAAMALAGSARHG